MFMIKKVIYANLTLVTLLSVLIYRAVADLSFIYYVIPFSSYERFIFQPNEIKIVESYILTIFFSLLLPQSTNRISTLIIFIFYLLVVVPFHSYYALGDQEPFAFYLGNSFWLLVLFFNRNLENFPVFRSAGQNIENYLIIAIMLLSVITFFLLIYFFGININLDFSIVYEIRKNFVDQKVPFAGYLVNWSAKVFLPFLALVAIYNTQKKIKYLPLLVVSFIEIYLFSVTGNKAYLFSLLLALFLGYVLTDRNQLFKLNFLFAGMALMCLFSLWMFDDIWLGSLFIRRMLFIPAKLSFNYFEFFSEHQYVYLSHSIFSSFIPYPYSLDPPFLIGQVFFDKPEMNANNGIMVDGYMNFGIPGLIIWAFILSVLIRLADSVSFDKNIRIFGPFFVVTFLNFIDGFLLTSLLTHGMLTAFVIAFFFPSSNQQAPEKIGEIK